MNRPKYINYSQSILITGLARNCENSIYKDVLKINKALFNFSSINWLVIESDSNDGTLNELKTLSNKMKNFRFITLGELQGDIPARTVRIAYCRNRYIKELDENPAYSSIDYVVVVDLDGVNDKLTKDSFESCWCRDDWAACSANQDGPYYDIFALRHSLWSPNDCFEQQSFFENKKVSKYTALKSSIYTRMIHIHPCSEWIEVDSAFGGLTIYRRDFIQNAKYIGVNNQDKEICEHVSFNKGVIENGGKVFVNPALINAGYTEHSIYARQHWQIILWIKYNVFDFFKKN
jgi:hypothetical protein